MKLDKETSEVVNQQKPFFDLVNSEGWKAAKDKLEKLVLENQSIFALDAEDSNQMFIEVAARQGAIEMLKTWIDDIEGEAEMYKKNFEEPSEEDRKAYIKRV